MKQIFQGWEAVSRLLAARAGDAARSAEAGHAAWLNAGQCASLLGIAARLPAHGVIVADEVGMGKTRIAVALAGAVVQAGGRVAVLVPPGLGFQWRSELADAGVQAPPLLRSVLQYLDAWEPEGDEGAQPWFTQPVVVVSHAFANWRLGGENSDPRRWALLPQLYAQWRKLREQRYPRKFHKRDKWHAKLPRHAARSIAEAIQAAHDDLPRELADKMAECTPWPGATDPTAYGRDQELRPQLERAVGLGLGTFDLIIIDEAHKSRNTKSALSALLDGVIVSSRQARRLAMTATPVELDATQWKDVLQRIDIDAGPLSGAIDDYAKAVELVRQTPLHAPTCQAYKTHAARFQAALSPYLLRRDKREDAHVQAFASYAQQSAHGYRHESEIAVDTASLTPTWKRAVCAAEALSVVTDHAVNPRLKRLRLTLGNGHGIAALLRPVAQDPEADHPCDDEDRDGGLGYGNGIKPRRAEAADAAATDGASTADKRAQRADWWLTVLAGAFRGGSEPLFDHPALLAAIDEIEALTERGEKVLVFGRFTRPLQALVDLLNARAMLRSLEQSAPWPQAKVHDADWPALQAAHRQLHRPGELTRTDLDVVLSRQYNSLRHQREAFREHLLERLEQGLREYACNTRASLVFSAFRSAVEGVTPAITTAVSDFAGQVLVSDDASSSLADELSPLAVVAKALQDLLGNRVMLPHPHELAAAFVELVEASADREYADANVDDELDDEQANAMWATLSSRLVEEFRHPQGGFARLMYGNTRPETRRLLQLAFNREHSFPKVLVAQSMVGREGLNLHKACRTVVLLHPEWNPGVVEQQIGRVDRVGSLWQKRLEQAIADGRAPDLPRIEIRPVVFRGTYDEKNWQLLRERWDDLRAQLHGVVISPLVAGKSALPMAVVDEINAAAPNFSPLTGIGVPFA